jgi:hypothetical protein
MEYKIVELVNATDAFNKIFGENKEKNLNVKLVYKLTKIIRKMSVELKDFYSVKNTLIEKYGEKQEKGGFQVKQDQMPEFLKEITPLLEEKITVELQLIPFKLLEESGIEISPNDFIMIEKFIEDKE